MNKVFMIRGSLFFCFILFVSGSLAQSPGRELVGKVKEATVFLEISHDHPLKEGKVESSGTGFFIDEHGRIATNHHVISPWVSAMGLPFPAPISSIKAYIHSGSDSVQKVPMRVISQSAERDLAVMAPQKNEVKVPASLGLIDGSELYETMSVWAFGYPYGKEHAVLADGPEVTITKGNISALRHGDRDTLRSVQMDASVAPGNSGGPLIASDGKLVGVVHRKGENEMNHAVPGHYLEQMIESLPDHKLPSSLSVRVKSEPSNAHLSIDGEMKGRTPVELDALAPGLHRIDLYRKGHRVQYARPSIRTDTSLRYELRPTDTQLLQRDTARAAEMELPEWSLAETLFEADFEDRDRFRTWHQNTGGLSQRTWYLEDGQLRQYKRDGTLHAITLSEQLGNAPYRMAARVKLPGKGSQGDDRAGLIFGDGPKGFYLFRIYRESNKAELAYHSRSPFGWSILQRRELDLELSPEVWYELSVSVLDERVRCRINGEKIMDLDLPALEKGGLGFYSVQSRASFDSLRVERLELKRSLESRPKEPGAESFWFTDRFDRNSGWWWPSVEDQRSPSTPFVGAVGTVLKAEGDDWHRMGFRRYRLNDLKARAIISTSQGGDKAAIEWSFLETDDERSFLRISSDSVVKLIHEAEGKERLIEADTMQNAFFGGPKLLNLTIDGGQLRFGNRSRTVLKAELPEEMTPEAGSFAFRLRDVKGIFHRITVNSVDRDAGEED